MRNCTLMNSSHCLGRGTHEKCQKGKKKLKDVISSPEQFFCFLVTLANKRCVEGKNSGGDDNPDNDWRQLNKPPA